MCVRVCAASIYFQEHFEKLPSETESTTTNKKIVIYSNILMLLFTLAKFPTFVPPIAI